MKKNILYSFFAGAFLFGNSCIFSQNGININVKNQANDISGQSYTVNNTTGLEEVVELLVHNQTGNNYTLRVTRWEYESTSANVATEWSDFLCWGHETDLTGGTCFSSSQMNTNPWTSPSNADVLVGDGEAGSLQVHINPHDLISATTKYRYYIVNADHGEKLDSVDVIISTNFAGVKEIKTTSKSSSISVLPNPADNFVNVSLGQVGDAYIKITDVLGKVVYEGSFNTIEKIDVESFKNGVYLANVNVKGSTLTKRFVVKH